MPAALIRALGPSEEHNKTHADSQRYALDKLNFATVCRTLSLVETFLLLTGHIAPLINAFGVDTPEGWTGLRGLWDVAGAAVAQIGRGGVMWQSVGFLAVTTLVGTVTEMPQVGSLPDVATGGRRAAKLTQG